MRVISPEIGERSTRGAFSRRVVASRATTGSRSLWVAVADMAPGALSAAHHHGEAETAICLLEGTATFLVGPDLAERVTAHAGDFVLVEPGEIHVEINESQTSSLRMIVVRSPDDIAVDVGPFVSDTSPRQGHQ